MKEIKNIKEEEELIITENIEIDPKDEVFDETINTTRSAAEVCDLDDFVDLVDLTSDDLIGAIDLTDIEGEIEIIEENIDPNVNLRCELCQTSFATVSSMYRHLRSKRHKLFEAAMFRTNKPDLFGMHTKREKTIQDIQSEMYNDSVINHQNFSARLYQFDTNNNHQLNNPGNGYLLVPSPQFNINKDPVTGHQTFPVHPHQFQMNYNHQTLKSKTFQLKSPEIGHQFVPSPQSQFKTHKVPVTGHSNNHQIAQLTPVHLNDSRIGHQTFPASPFQFQFEKNPAIDHQISQKETPFNFKIENEQNQYKIVVETIKQEGVDINTPNIHDITSQPIQHQSRRKAFICTQCMKNFSSISNLNRHTNLHLPDDIFKCPTCPKTFKQKEYWKKHSFSCRMRPEKTRRMPAKYFNLMFEYKTDNNES
ncbi:unnamed protein product [Chironomus riparius]|uniref:C2H2-type domain-containing protein n=1 Tax=Chironomus riparius TaxID=315576 RepID=A0A9N9RPH0_9DIPT|nr:unnamed protein product [Chironomus riparius]